jgi:catechol 2,3-dioxygenase-like lactoylglutathione lyase family enzyme
MNHIAAVTLVVHDYDEAIAFYVDAVGFQLIDDLALPDGKRWVVVAPVHDKSTLHGTGLLLAKADGDAQSARIGDQTAGRVGFFLHTDDFEGDHARMSAAGVRFREAPRYEPYGVVAVFEDLYGNTWDLIQPVTA